MPVYANLLPGDPAPWFRQRAISNPNYNFDTAAGRYLVLLFFGTASDAHSVSAIEAVRSRPDLFDDVHASFFGVSFDPADVAEQRIADHYPGYRFLLDFDGQIGRLYGALPRESDKESRVQARRFWVVIDPTMRVMRVLPFSPDAAELIACVAGLPPPSRFAGFELQAPIIVLPNVLEPEICARLIGHYQEAGGQPSGFMREVDGKTVVVTDPDHKRRRDADITDPELVRMLQARFQRRVAPEIAKVHQFHATRMERYIVACYLAEESGHFRAHRDNTTKGTAHRRFAVTVNLNADFEGGEISFPEYGPRGFKPPVGAALVFSCSLLHMVSPVRTGKRYAFLPFLYDDAAAKQREQNNEFLGEGVGAYRMGKGEG